jgi:hypothetical protein
MALRGICTFAIIEALYESGADWQCSKQIFKMIDLYLLNLSDYRTLSDLRINQGNHTC